MVLSLVCTGSYAYVNYIGKTNNDVTITAGTLALDFKNESNALSITGVPQEDNEALRDNDEYTFTVENKGTLKSEYKITLNNKESRRLAELRDTLLPRLMSGEIKVEDATL